MGMSLTLFLALGVVVAAGAFVQRIAGFGLAVVAAPFVVLAAPHVMPVALLVVVLPLPVLEMLRNRDAVLWRPFGWAMAGRLLTMPLGVWLVAHSSHAAIAVGVSALVLVAVAGSLTPVRVRASGGLSLLAGMLTGVSATAASIGGPFFGLVLQEEHPRRARSTLAPFFLLGSVTSLIGLAAGHQMTREGLMAGLAWLPFMVLGGACAQPLRHRIDQARFKRAVFVLATASALGVLVRVALG